MQAVVAPVMMLGSACVLFLPDSTCTRAMLQIYRPKYTVCWIINLHANCHDAASSTSLMATSMWMLLPMWCAAAKRPSSAAQICTNAYQVRVLMHWQQGCNVQVTQLDALGSWCTRANNFRHTFDVGILCAQYLSQAVAPTRVLACSFPDFNCNLSSY